jgi:spore germination protein GerM
MRNLFITTLLLIPVVAIAENDAFKNMDKAQMQRVMQQMKAMQNCLKSIEKADLQVFEAQAKQMNAAVKSLCAAGKRDAAMARAMDFGKEVAANKAMQKMKECGEGVSEAMPLLPDVAEPQNPNGKSRHVCDH